MCGDDVWTRDQIRNPHKCFNYWVAEDRSAAAATIDYLGTLSSITIVPAHCPDAADEVLGPAWRDPRSVRRQTAFVKQ